jgi:hypothetical protein
MSRGSGPAAEINLCASGTETFPYYHLFTPHGADWIWAMRNPIDIDRTHSFAIVREIGERLRLSLKEEPELPASFKIAGLRQLENRDPPSILPSESAAEVASNSAWRTYLLLNVEVNEDDDRRTTLRRYIAHLWADGERSPDALQTAGLVYLRKLDRLGEERNRRLATYRALNKTR